MQTMLGYFFKISPVCYGISSKINYFLPKNLKSWPFVNSDLGLIEHITKFVDLDLIQLHGDESISVIKAIKQD